MKPITFLLLFIFSNSIAQTKIDGVGFFRIGKQKSEILDSVKSYLGEPIDFVKTEFTQGHIYKAIEGNNTGKDEDVNMWYYCPEYESYVIPAFTISGIYFENIDLIFYRDSLVSFRSHCSKEIQNAINTKYGKGKEVKKYSNGSLLCYQIIWRDNNIFCRGQYYPALIDDPILYSSFFIEKKQTFERVSNCTTKYLNTRIKERKALRRRP